MKLLKDLLELKDSLGASSIYDDTYLEIERIIDENFTQADIDSIGDEV